MNRQKGSDFERSICKKLSLWWSCNWRDDLFWRTSMSGGRATVRSKTGKSTDLQCGDISATDPDAVPFIKCLTVELKRGYQKACPFDLLDSNATKTLEWLLFLKQVQTAQANAQTPWWCIIFQRDRRHACIAIPFSMWKLRINSRSDMNRILVRAGGHDFVVLILDDFLAAWNPEWFRKQAAEMEKEMTW